MNNMSTINQTRKFALALTGLTILLPVVASAFDDHDFSEAARKKVPYAYAVGGYLPTTSSGSVSLGTDIWSAYRYPTGNFDFRTTTHGEIYTANDGDPSGTSFNVQTNGYDALYRLNAWYGGPGISLVSQSANPFTYPFSKPWSTVFTFTVGFDFTTRIFVEANWNAFGADPNRGVSLSAGYRY